MVAGRFRPRKLLGANLPMTGPLPGQTFAGFVWSDTLAQLKLAAGLGLNVVRVLGTVGYVANGTISLADYLSRWTTIVQGAASLGLWVYPCGTWGYPGTIDASFTASDALNVVPKLVTLLSGFRNVIGFDLENEAGAWSNSTDAGNLYSACRGLTNLPLTFSGVSNVDYPSLCDVIDVHAYPAGGLANVSTLIATYPDRDVILGEFGSVGTNSSTDRANWYYSSMLYTATVANGGSDIAGAIAWSIQDYDTVASNQYGIYDESGTAYGYLTAQVAGALSRCTVTPLPPAPASVVGCPARPGLRSFQGFSRGQ